MKIKLTNGSELETDNMTDFSAELTERIESFGVYCKQNKIPFVLIAGDKQTNKSHLVFAHSSREEVSGTLGQINFFLSDECMKTGYTLAPVAP